MPHAVTPVPYTCPDGVERLLRSTRGAKQLMGEKFGRDKSLIDILNERGDDALIDIAIFMMYDDQGNPPDITPKRFAFAMPQTTDATAGLMAAVMSALSQGQTPKNELEARVKDFLETQARAETEKLMSLVSGPSADSASDSQTASTGGDTAKRKSKRSSIDTESKSESRIIVLD